MVKPKKHLGQHFLKDERVAQRIADALSPQQKIVEIGPGTGVLTQYLVDRDSSLTVIEVDSESVQYLQLHLNDGINEIIEGDFLKIDLASAFKNPFAVIGNFPYNISSQIVFKILDTKELIPEVVGMFQKEVAERIAAESGSKTYGILSVLTAAYYEREYLFTVEPEVFNPPPKVRSGVIRLVRKENLELGCTEKGLQRVVKTAFNQRRKTLRNALKSLNLPADSVDEALLSKRAEQLDLEDFITITKALEVDEL